YAAADIRRTRFPRDLLLRDVIARLTPGVSVAQGQEEMNRIAADLEKEHPDTNRGWRVKVTGLKAWQSQKLRAPLLALHLATGIILLMACLNVANLLLIRGESRRRETAIRAALGSSRLRLLRQPLTESLLLSGAGGITGAVLAVFCRNALLRFAPDGYGIPQEFGIESPVLLWALGITVLAGILSGLLPALRVSSSHLCQVLGETGRSASPGRDQRGLLNGLVVGQIAISTILLATAALTFISFQKLMWVDPGFARNHTLSFRVDPYPKPEVTRKIMEGLSSLPGVQSVGGANIELLNDLFSNGVRITWGGHSDGADGAVLTADYWRVTADYFSTIGLPLLAGRGFSDHDPFDLQGGRLVIINEALARRFFPNQDPVGQTIRLLPRDGKNVPLQVIGVVGSVKHHGLREDAVPILYVHAQDAPALVVRSEMRPTALVPMVRSVLRSVDSKLVMSRVATTDQIVERSLAGNRFATLLMLGLAILGLVLAALGLFGVLSYAVDRRRQEIGIRLAVGAQREDVMRLILRQGVTLVLLGMGSGAIIAVLLGQTLQRLLFRISPGDPLLWTAVSIVLGSVALLACWFPARRAARVDPAEALRTE
ncbi:MAG: ABC transporter permease, partial [Verrucomicrobiae bacterium]|nr:ABC transporter permease [Verrucomicrobiae bacterium]